MTLSTAIADTSVDALEKGVRGEVIRAGAPGYDQARKIWNGMIDKRPALIVRCAGVSDVDRVSAAPGRSAGAGRSGAPPTGQVRDLLRFYREFCADLPDEAEAYAALLSSPEGEPLAALLLGYTGSLDEGERVLAPARQFGSPVADLVGPMPYVQRQRLIDDPLGINGIHRYWKSGFANELSDDFIDLMVEQAGTRPSPLTAIGLFYVHGAAARVDPSATAFGLRGNQWDFDIISQWTNPAEAPIHVQWTRQFWSVAEPFTTGAVYVNHIAEDEPGRVHAAFGNNYERLAAVKSRYDPTNLFRLNHNITPRA